MNTDSHISAQETNTLFPVFLKLEQMRLLIVGGGKVALEKLSAVVHNSPATRITLVAISISEEIKQITGHHATLQLRERPYLVDDLVDADLVIVAVNDRSISERIYADAKAKAKLINIADTPDLCDFYLGSIVKKGNLKIAISTNGKSPTMAKRLKEVFSDALPDHVDDLLNNMHALRGKLKGNLSEKITRLNEITRLLAPDHDDTQQ